MTGALDVHTATLILSDAADGTITGLTAGANDSYTAMGSAATVNAKLAAAAFVPAGNGNAYATIAVSIADGTNRVITGTITLNGIAVNDAPTLTGLSSTVEFQKYLGRTIDEDVSFTHLNDNFAGGRPTVSGLLADDNVLIPNHGPDPGRSTSRYDRAWTIVPPAGRGDYVQNGFLFSVHS